jgi:hypothetical protein
VLPSYSPEQYRTSRKSLTHLRSIALEPRYEVTLRTRKLIIELASTV